MGRGGRDRMIDLQLPIQLVPIITYVPIPLMAKCTQYNIVW